MLDWGALLLTQVKQVDVAFSGMGYAAFAIALTISRFMGDAVVTRFGTRTILVAGFFLTAIGVGIAAFATGLTAVMAGNLHLAIPRFVNADFPEIKTTAAREAFVERQIRNFENLEELRALSPKLATEVDLRLSNLAPPLEDRQHVDTDDLLLFPLLARKTCPSSSGS